MHYRTWTLAICVLAAACTTASPTATPPTTATATSPAATTAAADPPSPPATASSPTPATAPTEACTTTAETLELATEADETATDDDTQHLLVSLYAAGLQLTRTDVPLLQALGTRTADAARQIPDQLAAGDPDLLTDHITTAIEALEAAHTACEQLGHL